MRGIESPDDPRFNELGGFGAVQKITPEELKGFQERSTVHPTTAGGEAGGVLTGGDALPSTLTPAQIQQQALEQVVSGATFPLELEAQGAEKAQLGIEAQAQTEKFLTDIASRGLIFSGAKTKGINTIEADKLAKMLNVDRKFALLIATGLETAAQNIAKEAVKEIQTGKKDATEALKALGFAVNPQTGQIEQTVESKREARLTATDIFSQDLQEAQFEFSQAKSQIQLAQAQEHLLIAQARLGVEQARERRLETEGGEEGNIFTDEDLREDLAGDLSIIGTYGSRDTALKSINANATAIGLRYGQQGLDLMLGEIDRQYPAPVAKTPGAGVSGQEVGAQFGEALKETALAPAEAIVGASQAVDKATLGFLKGLFGF